MTSSFDPGMILFGGDWNPDQWSPEVLREDVELMKRARVNTVTICPFSWSTMEPREGEYVFDWLDEAVALISQANIGFFMSTPTACPPPWFTLAHPDALPVTAQGVQLSHGSRDTYAVAAPAYREAAHRIAAELGRRYGKHCGLRGWHIHNEYGTIDYGPHAQRNFRIWLRKRYGSLDALNAAWGTAFWSQRYSSWEEIMPPVATQWRLNPGLLLDFKRYSSDEMLAALGEQAEAIRAHGSQMPITTNFMLPDWNTIEQWSWAKNLDVISLDHYLDDNGDEGLAHIAYGSDLARSWSGGAWILMEQNASRIRIGQAALPKSSYRTIRDSLGYIARGSQSALFFQWRASSAGAEQWHAALVPHVGADSQEFRTAQQLGSILERLSPAVHELPDDGRLSDAQVALIWHADYWWALETPDKPSDVFVYRTQMRAFHRALRALGIACDFVAPGSDISSYALVVAPLTYTMSPDDASWLDNAARAGAHVLVTYLSGIADPSMRVITAGYPGALREMLGIRVDALLPLAPDQSVALRRAAPSTISGHGDEATASEDLRAHLWSESVNLAGAQAVYTYSSGPLAGKPALTHHYLGQGSSWYLSTVADEESLTHILRTIINQARVHPAVEGAAELGIEAVVRRSRGRDHVFLFNDGDQTVDVCGCGTLVMSWEQEHIHRESHDSLGYSQPHSPDKNDTEPSGRSQDHASPLLRLGAHSWAVVQVSSGQARGLRVLAAE